MLIVVPSKFGHVTVWERALWCSDSRTVSGLRLGGGAVGYDCLLE